MAKLLITHHIIALLYIFLIILTRILLALVAGPLLCIWKCVVIFYVKSFKSDDFGSPVNYLGALFTSLEEHTPSRNKFSVACHLSLDGPPLELSTLTTLFQRNVLQCKSPSGEERYPELKQHLVTFGGYRFWRNDANFRIEDHIHERFYPEEIPSPAKLFEEGLNTAFPERQSPWELLLVKKREHGNGDDGCVLLLRIYHAMADAKSVIKLVVEGLGEKRLKSPESKISNSTKKRSSIAAMLKHRAFVLSTIFQLRMMGVRTHGHPWRVTDVPNDNSPFAVDSTEKISLEGLKSIAKRNEMETSALLMAIIAGAVRRFNLNRAKSRIGGGGGGVPASWTLPKPNHPPHLTNHTYYAYPTLPTNEPELETRLKRCRDSFREIRFSDFRHSLDFGARLACLMVDPLTKELAEMDQAVPLGITNIAGDSEGFSVGGRLCLDFNFCVNIPRSSTGVLFIIFSYKDAINISVVAKTSILGELELGKLINSVQEEVDFLYEAEFNSPSIVIV